MRLDGAGRGGPAMLKSVQVFRQPNNRWRRFHETRTLSLESKPLLFPGDTVFAMGSCFAREIRQALTAIGITVGSLVGCPGVGGTTCVHASVYVCKPPQIRALF